MKAQRATQVRAQKLTRVHKNGEGLGNDLKVRLLQILLCCVVYVPLVLCERNNRVI